MMYTTYGVRPDGRPYSYLPFPLPLPECPTNRLVIFDEFSSDEIARLNDLIGSREYSEHIDQETSYYRGYWLAARLDRDEGVVLSLLLRAVWEATPAMMGAINTSKNRARARRYNVEFVQRVEDHWNSIATDERMVFYGRAANAYRVLGNFSKAERMRERALSALQTTPEKVAEGWEDYLAKLNEAILRRDRSVEPLDMIPERQIKFACEERKKLSRFETGICRTHTVTR